MYRKARKSCSFRYAKVLDNILIVRGYHSENIFGHRKRLRPSYQVPDEVIKNRCKESNFYRLVTAYRQHGHKYADINPVAFHPPQRFAPELDIKRFGFEENDTVWVRKGIVQIPEGEVAVKSATTSLSRMYCEQASAEFLYLENEDEREWFSEEFEKLASEQLNDAEKIVLVKDLLRSQALDHFLAKKFSSVKRYGGEGAESMMGFFSRIFHLAANDNVEQIVLAMPHRGRLNVLTGLLNFPPVKMFYKLRGNCEIPSKYRTLGDVLSHLVSSVDLKFGDKSVHVSLLYNPSHLEAVNPVSMGKTRAKNLISRYGDYGNLNEFGDKILNIQVHGDAAIIGQGVNQECLTLSGAPNFNIGGTVHLVVNNQVGYTTPGDRGRSSRYCTDLAKVIAAPVIHVNGNYPEEVYKITKLAFDYQRRYKKDIFVDMNCYRRWGHNEMDDPTFTNPALYKVINAMRTVPDSYAAKIIEEGVLSEQQCQEIYEERFEWLNEELQAIEDYQPEDVYFQHQWAGMSQPENAITTWDTGVDTELLAFVGERSVAVPEDFTVHPTLTRHVKNRLSRVAEGMNIDWSTAEALAIGSLLFEGYNVRVSGQDVGRGTFSQRHAMLVDQNTNQMFIPLNSLYPEQTANLEVANSILSEEAVLGYEYGLSIESPKNLIVWEAQFGDFFNGAQIIFDTFVTCGEAKWLWQSALAVLLPHGYDGAGPEHSSARIERFLQLTDSKDDAVDGDDVNLQVCHPSTPAQYFHLLRRQMVRNFRKPLIVFTPKTLLRSPLCVSSYQDMIKGTHFKPVLGDTSCEPSSARRLLITSGKHYYNLLEAKQSLECETVAIIRLESYCPFPTAELLQEVLKYNHLKDILWCQEEPQNMGAWSFVKRRFENLIGKPIKFCGRPASATPAVGFAQVHLEQANDILTKPFQM